MNKERLDRNLRLVPQDMQEAATARTQWYHALTNEIAYRHALQSLQRLKSLAWATIEAITPTVVYSILIVVFLVFCALLIVAMGNGL